MPRQFFWYDVMTTDTESAKAFYRQVVGWGTQESGADTPGYTLLTVKDQGVAGLMAIPPEARKADVGPAWMGYVRVEDVEATAKQIQREGGTLHRGPIEMPGVIRFAVVSDPQGAGFIIAKPLPALAPPPLPTGTPGTVGWHELYASDWKAVFPFYEKLFGWTKAAAHDMGLMGTYPLFAAGGEPIGGMMNKPPQSSVPFWNYYVNVPAIDSATARITAGGGTIHNGPMQVPSGDWIVQATDPQGAWFALMAPRR